MEFEGASDDDDTPKVRVRFTTKIPSLRVTDLPIAVPETLGRYGLSEVINHLLGLKGPPAAAETETENGDPETETDRAPIPFDVLAGGRFLRTSLARYMRAAAVSGETVLELEYLPALRAPTEDGGDEAPDWVSAVVAGGGGQQEGGVFVASACYDGCLRLYTGGLSIAHSARVSQQPLTALAAAPAAQGSEDHWLLAGGKDRTLSLWRLGGGGGQRSLEQAAVLRGHQNSIAAVSLLPEGGDGYGAASGDWDGRVCLWEPFSSAAAAANNGDTTTTSDGPGGVKRRKRAAAAAADVALAEVEPSAVFVAHSQAVTGVHLASPTALYTGSWDRSVKTWDASRQDCIHTMACAKAVGCLGACGDAAAAGLVATGHPDGRIRVWDVRTKAGETLTLTTLASRGGWVYGVAWEEGSTHHLASSSKDGAVRLWDIRSAAALRSLPAHKDAALCVAWRGGSVTSGGEDGAVRAYRVSGAATA